MRDQYLSFWNFRKNQFWPCSPWNSPIILPLSKHIIKIFACFENLISKRLEFMPISCWSSHHFAFFSVTQAWCFTVTLNFAVKLSFRLFSLGLLRIHYIIYLFNDMTWHDTFFKSCIWYFTPLNYPIYILSLMNLSA